MERCPCCTARLGGADQCPRCQADLSPMLNARKAAIFWLSRSVQYWQENKTGLSLAALNRSIQLYKIRLALIFREYLIQHTCHEVLNLLAEKQLLPAKQQLFKMRQLSPYSKQLQKLHMFTEYLLVRDYSCAASQGERTRGLVVPGSGQAALFTRRAREPEEKQSRHTKNCVKSFEGVLRSLRRACDGVAKRHVRRTSGAPKA